MSPVELRKLLLAELACQVRRSRLDPLEQLLGSPEKQSLKWFLPYCCQLHAAAPVSLLLDPG